MGQGVQPVVRGVCAAIGQVLQFQGGVQMPLCFHRERDAFGQTLRMGHIGAHSFGNKVDKIPRISLPEIVCHHP